MNRFLNPRLKSVSRGPNQVIRGSSGVAAMTSIGSNPLWWFTTSWNGGVGHRDRPSTRISKRSRKTWRLSAQKMR
jgi:hypothetical protein